MGDVLLETPEPGIALLTLNRPERLNALSWPMIDELHATFERIGADRETRVVVITGAGRGFCAGLDIAREDAIGSEDDVVTVFRRQERVADLALALRDLPQPVIAAVNGPAAGGGMAIGLACDVRVFSREGRMNVAFVKIGLSGCDVGVSHLLPRLVGMGRASELMLTGRQVLADEALAIGLANHVVEPGEEVPRSLEIARAIAANSPFGVWMTKQVLHRNVDAPSLEAAIDLENRTQALTTRTRDLPEALEAFQQKRAPRFEFR